MITLAPPVLLQGVRAALQEALRIKGLLEMAHEVLSDWVRPCCIDTKQTPPPCFCVCACNDTGASQEGRLSFSYSHDIVVLLLPLPLPWNWGHLWHGRAHMGSQMLCWHVGVSMTPHQTGGQCGRLRRAGGRLHP